LSHFKKLLFIIYVLLISFNIILFADWNKDFDDQTDRMIHNLAPLQNPFYLNTYQFFKGIRAQLLKDSELVQIIQSLPMNEKFMLKNESLKIIIKKRYNDNLNDIYPWELSFLTNSNAYIVPAFPLKIGGKIVILQPLESFQVGSIDLGIDQNISKKVSLKNYWKAQLQAYTVGLADLVATNIGINDKGLIRFFDNESCFMFRNIPERNNKSFRIGYLCQAIDWRQYRVPMDSKTAKAVQEYVWSFCDNFEENLYTYLSFRPFSFPIEELQVRLQILRDFKFSKGKTFADFHRFLYPRMDKGLNALRKIVSNILGMKAGYSASITFVTRRMKYFNLTTEQSHSIQKWIDRYID
jgi:hypothetical protein